MPRFLYIHKDPASTERATHLGCGWMPQVPAEFASIAVAPCVIVAGAGRAVVIPDGPGLSPAAVALEGSRIQAEELAATPRVVLTDLEKLTALVVYAVEDEAKRQDVAATAVANDLAPAEQLAPLTSVTAEQLDALADAKRPKDESSPNTALLLTLAALGGAAATTTTDVMRGILF